MDFPHLTTDELKYMHVADKLSSTDLPIKDLKPLPQRFQEGCIGEKKKTPKKQHAAGERHNDLFQRPIGHKPQVFGRSHI